MKQTYRVLAGLIALGVVLQAASVAFGWFDVLNQVDDGSLVVDGDFEFTAGLIMHSIIGLMVMPLLGLVLLIVSFFAKLPGGVKVAAGLFGAIVVQVLLAFVSFGVPIVGLLHGANALVVLGLALLAVRKAKEAGSAPAMDARQHAAV